MKTGNGPKLATAVACVALALWATAGCGNKAPGDISGVVKLDGKPLPSGRVTFLSQAAGARACFAAIEPNGSYSITGCPTGPVVITVETYDIPPRAPASVEGPRDRSKPWIVPLPEHVKEARRKKEQEAATFKYVPIPRRYGDAARSGLNYTVVSGSQAYDVELSSSK
jgi:hypothetical protein